MKRFLFFLVLMLLPAGSVWGDVIATFAGLTPDGANTRFSYNVEVTSGHQIEPGDWFTIYDFTGYVANSGVQPSPWTLGIQNVGITPPTVSPDDDPGLPNLTWTWSGVNAIVGPTSVGTFSAASPLSAAAALDHFAAISTLSGGGKTSNIELTSVPAVPEPASGCLAVMAVLVCFRRSRQFIA